MEGVAATGPADGAADISVTPSEIGASKYKFISKRGGCTGRCGGLHYDIHDLL